MLLERRAVASSSPRLRHQGLQQTPHQRYRCHGILRGGERTVLHHCRQSVLLDLEASIELFELVRTGLNWFEPV